MVTPFQATDYNLRSMGDLKSDSTGFPTAAIYFRDYEDSGYEPLINRT